ncbi:MAG: cation transporter [Betaproteobacteria bacterium]|nr:cation transporter [Betaproteobacteria bacterium]
MTDSEAQQGLSADRDRRTLTQVLLINVAQCAVGIAVGVWANSTAILGSALDNLADAGVYGVSLYAVGRAARFKVLAARLSGWLLMGLAVLLLIEVVRRFMGSETPLGIAMMIMAAVNAGVNLVCLRLLAKHRGDDVNFKASAVFTSNDSLVNLSIVVSGALVLWLGSNVPDLVLGIVVAGIAAHGGREILEAAQKAENGAGITESK